MTQDQTIQRALKILAARMRTASALSSPAAVRDYLRLLLHDRPHEVFVCVFLDAQHRVMPARNCFAARWRKPASTRARWSRRRWRTTPPRSSSPTTTLAAVAEPSRADELLTQALKQALALVDVRVLDHFVIAGAGAVSFAERGLL